MPFGQVDHTRLRPREPWAPGSEGSLAGQASIRFRSPAGTAAVSVLPGGGKGQMK